MAPPPTYLAHTQTPLVQTYPVISGPSVMSPTSPPNSVPQQRCWPTPPPPGGCVPLLPLLLLLLLLLSSSNRGRLLACSTCCCGDCDCCRPSRRIRWAGEKASRYVLQTRAVRSGTRGLCRQHHTHDIPMWCQKLTLHSTFGTYCSPKPCRSVEKYTYARSPTRQSIHS